MTVANVPDAETRRLPRYPDSHQFDSCFHERKRVYTEIFLVHKSEKPSGGADTVLLGRKKRGFKAGKYFGYGGKVENTDSSILHGAQRELEEESGVTLPLETLQKVGEVYVQFPPVVAEQSGAGGAAPTVKELAKYLEIHVFRADVTVAGGANASREEPRMCEESEELDEGFKLEGTNVPVETDEMAPAWFPVDAVPWEECLPDVKEWYPLAFRGEAPFIAQFRLGEKDAVEWEDVTVNAGP